MKPAVASIADDLAARPTQWRVTLRDRKSGRLMPVMVPEADSAHVAISAAMNRAARFFPTDAFDWVPSTAHRVLVR